MNICVYMNHYIYKISFWFYSYNLRTSFLEIDWVVIPVFMITYQSIHYENNIFYVNKLWSSQEKFPVNFSTRLKICNKF